MSDGRLHVQSPASPVSMSQGKGVHAVLRLAAQYAPAIENSRDGGHTNTTIKTS